MAVDFYAKAGDQLPALVSVLVDENGDPVDLTGAAIRWQMRALGEATLIVDAAAEAGDDPGEARYWWAEGDLDTPGTYLGEWQVTFPVGGQQTFPADRQMVVLVAPDVEAAHQLTADDLGWLRSWVGTSPDDSELARRLAAAGSREAVALGILRERRADLLADPLSYSIRGDVTVNATDNLRALDASISTMEGLAGEGEGTLVAARLERVGGWGRGWGGRRR